MTFLAALRCDRVDAPLDQPVNGQSFADYVEQWLVPTFSPGNIVIMDNLSSHDNAVAESFFSPLKRERIRRRTYKTREEARQDVFDCIEMFYNPLNGVLSPVEFGRKQFLKAEGV